MADRIPSNRDQYVELCLIGTEQRANKPRQPQIRQPQPPKVRQPRQPKVHQPQPPRVSQPKLPRRTQASAEERREFERIAEVMGVEPTQLLERLQDKTIPEHRYSAMWVLVQYGLSMRAVGRLLQIDSKMVSYAVGRIEQKRLADGAFAARVDALAREVTQR